MSRRNIFDYGKEFRDFLNNTILKTSFLSSDNIKDNEIVDITNNYGWTAKLLNGSIKDKKELGQNQFTHQIPFAMAFERKQTINSTIRNIAQSLTIGQDFIGTVFTGKAKDLISGIQNAAKETIGSSTPKTTPQQSEVQTNGSGTNGTSNEGEETSDTAEKEVPNQTATNKEKALSYTKSALTDLLNFVKQAYNTVSRPDDHLKTSFLYPYAFMYMTEPTGFQFAFPMLTSGSDYFSVTNQWTGGDGSNRTSGSGGTTDLLHNIVTNTLEGMVEMGSALYIDVMNVMDAVNRSNRTVQDYYIEKAKFYNYSTEGQKVKIQFTLYNTVQKDIWKKHYRFLYLFALRNLPFKFTPFSYSPPLLYDIFLPGSKYLPLCYVSNFNVMNQGVTRRLSTDSILNTGSKVQVSVPDAWTIDLEFTCMLGPSANLMLAAIEHETSISVISTDQVEIKKIQETELLGDARYEAQNSGAQGQQSGTYEQGIGFA